MDTTEYSWNGASVVRTKPAVNPSASSTMEPAHESSADTQADVTRLTPVDDDRQPSQDRTQQSPDLSTIKLRRRIDSAWHDDEQPTDTKDNTD
jgi:hypothetical protein